MDFSISETPIDPDALKATLANSAAGACVTFEGWVRETNDGREVTALTYEAYRALAENEGEAILTAARERFGLAAAHAVHRVGPLAIGDLAVWVGVSAGHRDEAFDACRWIIDEVKSRVPIWKHEHYTDSPAHWINSQDPS